MILPIIIVSVLIIALLIVINKFSEEMSRCSSRHIPEDKSVHSFYDLGGEAKIRYIVDTFFKGPEEENANQIAQQNAQDNWISSLPRSSAGCEDQYPQCQNWAQNGECTINPEFMLYSCAQSCSACALNPSDKFRITQIYNTRTPTQCPHHTPYPNVRKYLDDFNKYHDIPAIPI